MLEEGPKRAGRFIKRDSKVLKKVALTDFSFEELREASVVGYDNPDRSIIHTRYHSPAVIEAIQNPDRFEVDLLPESMRRPVIRPLDFTAEWEEERRRSKQRKTKEEEEFDYQHIAEMAAKEAEMHAESTMSGESPQSDENDASPTVSEFRPAHSAGAPHSTHAEPEDSAKDARPPVRDYENVDLVSDAINTLSRTGEGGQPALTADDPTAIAAGRDEFIPQSTAKGRLNESLQEGTQADAGSGSLQALDPEEGPAEVYRRKVTEQAEVKTEEIVQEARSRGYEDGFRQGEEKAALALRQQASEMFGKVAELVREFEGLKMQILDSVQDNFYELAQAVAESLLRREFSLRPQALADVIGRAVSEGLGGDKFRIKVHPDTFANLQELGVQGLSDNLTKDPDMEPGDFRLESDMSVVDGNIRKLVSDLLAQADLDLFKDGPVDGEDEENGGGSKAG